jgi:hypothetical protein
VSRGGTVLSAAAAVRLGGSPAVSARAVFDLKIMVPDAAPLSGILMRLATMGGYHIEALLARLPPLEQEMRRRAWSLCMQLDLLISFHLGVPSTVQFSAQTKPPTSLRDTSSDEDTRCLPPEETDPEASPMMFIIAKHNFMMIFDKVLRHALAEVPDSGGSVLNVTAQDTSEVNKLDAQLRDLSHRLPPASRPKPMADSVFDSPKIIVTRLCLSSSTASASASCTAPTCCAAARRACSPATLHRPTW